LRWDPQLPIGCRNGQHKPGVFTCDNVLASQPV
jgi:hypothetical protein